MTNSNHISGDHRDEALENVPANERAELNDIWDLVANADESPVFSDDEINQTWQNLSAFAIKHETRTTTETHRPKLRLVSNKRFWMSLAASLLIGAIGLAWWMQPVTISVAEGEQLAVTLPDGTTIELNSGSTISYPRNFGKTRDLHLTGEGFFEVASSDVPFVLTTFNARIEVLGTTFNVKSWENSIAPETAVSLIEGSVLFSPADLNGQGVVMKPGQKRIVAEDANVSPPDTLVERDASAWKSGDFLYKDVWLGVVLEDIERKYAIQIDLQAEELLKKEFTFIYRQASVADAVIQSLCEALDLRYSKTSRGVVIYYPPSNS